MNKTSPFKILLILSLMSVGLWGCSGFPFFGDDETIPKSRVSLAFPLPDELKVVPEEDLFANLSIYENKNQFKVVHESELLVSKGLVQFEEFTHPEFLKKATDATEDTIPLEPEEKAQNEIIVKSKKDYTFVVLFQIHTGNGNLLPAAYIRKTLSFNKSSALLSFIHEDFTFNNPSDVLNDLSANFTINEINLPNLDMDGDSSSNLLEYLDETNPADRAIYPTPNLPRCGNGIVNAKEECDDGNTDDSDTCNAQCQKAPPIIRIISPQSTQASRDVVIVLAEAESPWGVRSLVLKDPTGIEDKDFSSETFQGSWDTTNLPDDEEIELVFIARDQEGRERTATLAIRVDNTPNIVSFGQGTTLNSGQSHNLSWEVSNFSTLSINNLDGGSRKLFTPSGTTSVSPSTSTVYTLTATRTNAQGLAFTSTSDVTVSVRGSPSTPILQKTPALTTDADTIFEWNTSSPGSSVCSPVTYSLTVKKPNVGGVRGETVFTAEGISQTSFNLLSLAEDRRLETRSSYEVQITAKNSCGISTSSSFLPFATLDKGLVGWWRFENSANLGLNSIDSSKNNGTLTDGHPGDGSNLPTQTSGVKTGTFAIQFTTFDPYLDLGNDNSLKNIKTEITTEAWVKPSELKNAILLSHGDANTGWAIFQEGQNLKIKVSNGASQAVSQASNVFSVNQWSLVSFSYDGKRIKTYVNGYLRDAPDLQDEIYYGALTKTMIATSESELGIVPPANLFFKGSIDEATLYNRALSSKEIRANCRRNDPSTLCAALGVPEPLLAKNRVELPPHRAYLFWNQVDLPVGKSISHYTLCYDANNNISGPADCLNSTNTTLPFAVIESLASLSNYSWKIFANYNDGSRSNASAVWNFTTNDSLIQNWNFASEGGIRDLNGSSFETVPAILTTGLQNEVTIEARAKVRDFNSSFTPFAIVSGGGSEGWRMQTSNVSGKIYCIIPTNAPLDEQIVMSFGFETDQFNHIVCSFDQTLNQKRIFINTISDDRGASAEHDTVSASGQINYTDSNVTLGKDPTATLDPFNGFIDEISIYDKALSEDAIKNNFCALEVLAGVSGINFLPNECK